MWYNIGFPNRGWEFDSPILLNASLRVGRGGSPDVTSGCGESKAGICSESVRNYEAGREHLDFYERSGNKSLVISDRFSHPAPQKKYLFSKAEYR